MPLESVFDHIDSIIGQIEKWNSSSVPYPMVRGNLNLSVGNYSNGLKIIKNLLSKAVVARAKAIQGEMEKRGKSMDIDEIIRRNWYRQVNTCYHVAERFNFNVNDQISHIIPFEAYYWLQSVFNQFGLRVPFVLQASDRFIDISFEEDILDPLSPLIEVSKEHYVPGTLKRESALDVLEGFPISNGHIIKYIRGEARNLSLWPILVHEVFHVVDREKGLFGSMVDYMLKKSRLPAFDKDETVNLRWIREIFIDIISIKYFGPSYVKSVVNYFERLPYIQTLEYPEMSLRLKAIRLYLNETTPYTDIFSRCKSLCIEAIDERIESFTKNDELPEEDKKIAAIYEVVSDWFDQLYISSFKKSLREYVEGGKAEESENVFRDPLYNFYEIKNLFYDDQISLAIDPNILLNVILADYSGYDANKHFEVMVDSIMKWRIKRSWNTAVSQ